MVEKETDTETAEQRAARRLARVGGDWDQVRVDRALGSLRRRLYRRRAVQVGTAITLVAGAAAAVLLVVVRRGAGDGQGVARSVGPSMRHDREPATTRLADGSTIAPAPGADVEVREVSPERVRVGVTRGRAAFAVARRPERTFEVETSTVRVVVVGTRFSVDVAEDRTRVAVDEGHVRVSWNDAGVTAVRQLWAGQEGVFPDARPQASDPDLARLAAELAEASEAPAATEQAQTLDAAAARQAEAAPTRPAPGRRARAHSGGSAGAGPGAEWRRLARQGGYRAAYELIVASGARAVSDTVEDLLLAADAARLSDDPVRAIGYLDQVLVRHAGDTRAPIAAFTRGRIHMALGRFADAAASFDLALSLGAQGSLHENALARASEAAGRAGDAARARKLGRDYLDRYPSGRWRALVEARLRAAPAGPR
jgi:tetratricopeptide (TPR) repeat protein